VKKLFPLLTILVFFIVFITACTKIVTTDIGGELLPPIDGVNTKVIGGEWHSLGLKAQGERFTIEFDGKTLFTTSDKTFAGAGRVALWTKSDSVIRFDQIAFDVLE